MVTCSIIPLPPFQTCSGSCKKLGGGGSLGLWVLAVQSEGATLFRQGMGGSLELLTSEERCASPRLEALQHYLTRSHEEGTLKQLVLVGDSTDMTWVRPLLPKLVAAQVVAEIEQPLTTSPPSPDGYPLALMLGVLLAPHAPLDTRQGCIPCA